MSYVEIFVAEEDGKFRSFAEAHNNHGYGPVMWDQVADEAGIERNGMFGGPLRPGERPRPILYDDKAFKELWRRMDAGELTRAQTLLMAGTEDKTYFVPEDVLDLADALDACLKAICEKTPIVRTMGVMAVTLRQIMTSGKTIRAVAFNACSANSAYWSMYDEEEDEMIPFDLDDPQKDARPSTHWKYREAAKEGPQEE